MKVVLLSAMAAVTVLGGSAAAQAQAQAAGAPTAEEVLARADQLRASVAAMQADIRRVSRDPAVAEERRAAEVENLSAKVQAESAALEELVNVYMAARKAQIKREWDQRSAGSAG